MPFRAIGALLCGGLLMLTASSAFAAVNLNSSRSNIYRSNCIKAGGKIVTDQNGKVVHWVCENQAPSTLVNFGFDATTFKSGDEVTVVMAAVAKNGAPIGRVNRIILANGYVMNSEVR